MGLKINDKPIEDMGIDEIGKHLKERQEAAKSIFDKLDAEGERAPNQDELKALKSGKAEIMELQARHGELAEVQEFRSTNRKGLEWLNSPEPGLPYGQRDLVRGVAAKTWGDKVIESPAFKAWLDSVAPIRGDQGRQFPREMKISSPGFELPKEGVKSLLSSIKTLLTGVSTTSGGAFLVEDRKPIVDPGTFMRPLRLADLVTKGDTNTDTVEYVRQGAHTNNAATVAEATASGGSSGAKPESAMAFAVITEVVKTIAHWIPATRRALADAGQLRTYIDLFLKYGLAEELEDQMINGDGSGENFTGVLNISGTTAQAFDTDLLTTYRKARTKVRITGRAVPTGYVVNPTDVENLDLLTDNEERYYFNGPIGVGVPLLWGVPLVECEGMTAGTAMVAQWDLAVLWDRMAATILMSDSHSDFFTRNLIAILAEMRAAFGVLRPAAFVEIALS